MDIPTLPGILGWTSQPCQGPSKPFRNPGMDRPTPPGPLGWTAQPFQKPRVDISSFQGPSQTF